MPTSNLGMTIGGAAALSAARGGGGRWAGWGGESVAGAGRRWALSGAGGTAADEGQVADLAGGRGERLDEGIDDLAVGLVVGPRLDQKAADRGDVALGAGLFDLVEDPGQLGQRQMGFEGGEDAGVGLRAVGLRGVNPLGLDP